MLFPILRRNIQRELQALAFVFDEAIHCVPDQPSNRDLPPLRHKAQQAALFGRQSRCGPRILAHPRRASECITLQRDDAHTVGRIKTIRELSHIVPILFFFQRENGPNTISLTWLGNFGEPGGVQPVGPGFRFSVGNDVIQQAPVARRGMRPGGVRCTRTEGERTKDVRRG